MGSFGCFLFYIHRHRMYVFLYTVTYKKEHTMDPELNHTFDLLWPGSSGFHDTHECICPPGRVPHYVGKDMDEHILQQLNTRFTGNIRWLEKANWKVFHTKKNVPLSHIP